ncbi:MAG: hypothetical protein COW13_05065 [Candidatus Omnitrophica bacterium CG12_big_fil_rev_8_21_14_0_65_50_5]|nr:MAG: hypothetical protein COW13_05065 [Candidatus Omnitrophica bacterium CG12_big_fil_rev_8_21_14_0_65_50_5]
MINIIIHILGWMGTALFVLAYYLVSNAKLPATGRAYQIINLVGAVCLGINVFYEQAWPAFGLEVIWAAIAIWALMKTFNQHDRKSSHSS